MIKERLIKVGNDYIAPSKISWIRFTDYVDSSGAYRYLVQLIIDGNEVSMGFDNKTDWEEAKEIISSNVNGINSFESDGSDSPIISATYSPKELK